MNTTLIPPDLNQCQAEKPNGYNAFTLGGVPGMVRCTNAPTVIATERDVAEDGLQGSMSLCDECRGKMIEQHGCGFAEFSPIVPEGNFMVITFGAEGGAAAMHRDEFDLGFLGKQSVARASEIMFDDGTQLWNVHLPVDEHRQQWHAAEPACGFDSYNAARKFEVRWLEECALVSAKPLSEEGIRIATKLRGAA